MRYTIILAALLLTSCQVNTPGTGSANVQKWTDPETDCVYILYRSGYGQAAVGSLSIRHRRDGKADCPDA